MSIVEDQYRFVFLHVAKTGGRSMNISLKERFGERGSFDTAGINPEVNILGRKLGIEARDLVGRSRWEAYFTFAFVRNPFDRVVSIYEHMRTSYLKDRNRFSRSKSHKSKLLDLVMDSLNADFESLTFEDFIKYVVRDRAVENYHWDTQYNAITDENGQILFDYLGKFENLQEDFDICCEKIGIPAYQLPHRNKAKRRECKSYYNSELEKIVLNCYREDFELLDYDSSILSN